MLLLQSRSQGRLKHAGTPIYESDGRLFGRPFRRDIGSAYLLSFPRVPSGHGNDATKESLAACPYSRSSSYSQPYSRDVPSQPAINYIQDVGTQSIYTHLGLQCLILA
jgi:hypothetical protein